MHSVPGISITVPFILASDCLLLQREKTNSGRIIRLKRWKSRLHSMTFLKEIYRSGLIMVLMLFSKSLGIVILYKWYGVLFHYLKRGSCQMRQIK